MLHDWADGEDIAILDATEGQLAPLTRQLEVYSSQIQDNMWLRSLMKLL